MTIGQWIKKQRTERGWSQADLATALWVNRSAIAQWELGTTKPHRLRRRDLTLHIGVVPDKIAKATWG